MQFRLRRILLWTFGIIAALAAIAAGTVAWYLWRSQDASFWAAEIAAFEAVDRERPPAVGGIVFAGSSSIRLWHTLADDMAPLPVVRRGFGGAHLDHVNYYIERIVTPYRPRAVVLYAGDNDLALGTGKTPERVAADFERFVARIHTELPDTRIYFVSIKPSLRRWNRWPRMRRANAMIAERCDGDPRLACLDVATAMLGADGKPRREIFVFDGLHLNPDGYALWTAVLRPRLLADWQAGVGSLPR